MVMWRPRRENADYFSHDTNMRSHRKIIALRSKFWITWYAIYNMFLEHIWSCNFFECKRDDIEQEILAWDFWIDFSLLWDIVSFCGRLWLIQIDWNIIKCQSLTDRLSDLIDKRNRERNRVSVTETPQEVAEMPQSKVKESKSIINNTSMELFDVDSLVYKYFKRFETKDWQIWSWYSQLKDYCIENWHTIDIDWWNETIERPWELPLVRRKKIKDIDRKFVNNKVFDVNAWELRAKREIKNPLTTLYKFMKS